MWKANLPIGDGPGVGNGNMSPVLMQYVRRGGLSCGIEMLSAGGGKRNSGSSRHY